MARRKQPKRPRPDPFPEPYLAAPLPHWSIPQREEDTPLVQWFKQHREFSMGSVFPSYILHALLVVAVRRLEKLNPHAARQFRDDAADLIANVSELSGLTSFANLLGAGGRPNVAKTKDDFEQWLDRFFAELERASVATDRRYKRKVPDAMRSLILAHYRRMVEAIQAAQATLDRAASYEAQCGAMRPALRAILDAAGPAGKGIELSEALTKAAVGMSPHLAAQDLAAAMFPEYPVTSIRKTRTLGAESKVRFRWIDSAVRPPS